MLRKFFPWVEFSLQRIRPINSGWSSIVTFPATKESPCFHQYICDVAFGPLSYVEPLSLDHDMLGQAQTTKYDTYRIVPYTFTNGEENDILDNYRDHYLVQIFTDKQAWANMYLFHKRELSTYSDWYGGNWEVATSPESMFVNAILLSIVTEDSIISLFNNELTIRLIKSVDDATSSEVTRKQLNREEVLNVLQEYFKFCVDTEFRANLQIPGIDTLSADKN